ncbi:MAG: DUF4105 domain-containing protein [Muribaculum sp.]|nr:DUF4105 domain-containing protein [Muribaculum sp.]
MRILIKIICTVIAAAVATAAAIAIPRPGSSAPHTPTPEDSTLTVSLITCYPGPEIYELEGHEALRIRGAGIDSVWNYGVFDFEEPNFIYRFVKGQTDYMLLGYPFPLFLTQYVYRGSKVVEQDLDLTPRQAADLRAMLQREQLPQNRMYRYNYVRDNCATRIVDRLMSTTEDSLNFRSDVRYDSFRHVMRTYHKDYPWYQFGIDLALGPGIDAPLSQRQQMFAPMEMMEDFRSARIGGRPAVKAERILYEGRGDVTAAPTPWPLTPFAVSFYVLGLTIAVAIYDIRKQKISRWWWGLYYGLAGIAGCVVTFLVFASDHDSTSPNMMILWLNPLQLGIAVCIWMWRKKWAWGAVTVLEWLNIILMCVMIPAWPLQSQSTNAAVFPLLGANVILALTWAIISRKISYKKEVKPRKSPAKRPRRRK